MLLLGTQRYTRVYQGILQGILGIPKYTPGNPGIPKYTPGIPGMNRHSGGAQGCVNMGGVGKSKKTRTATQ